MGSNVTMTPPFKKCVYTFYTNTIFTLEFAVNSSTTAYRICITLQHLTNHSKIM